MTIFIAGAENLMARKGGGAYEISLYGYKIKSRISYLTFPTMHADRFRHPDEYGPIDMRRLSLDPMESVGKS